MGRPSRYDPDLLLDAAVILAAGPGPQAVTMSAVIAATGAPSGSLYHRFPSRPALLAALWLRTLERFQAGFLEAAGGTDGLTSALATARHTVEWSRAHQNEARVLIYGAADFGHDEWPQPQRQLLASRQDGVTEALAGLAARLGLTGDNGREQVALATVDLPLALVRRHLGAGQPVPKGAERLIEPAVRALLSLP